MTVRADPASARAPQIDTSKTPRSNELVLAPMRVPANFPTVDGVTPTVIEDQPAEASSEDDRGIDIVRVLSGAYTRCEAGDLTYFDVRAQLYRPCNTSPRAATAAANANISQRRRTPRSPSECRGTVGAYYDPVDRLYRPCGTPAGVETGATNATNNAQRAPGPRTPHQCRGNDRVYYDAVDQIFRPCVTTSSDTSVATSGGATRPKPPNRRSGSSRARCAAGERIYYDEQSQLFRPCR